MHIITRGDCVRIFFYKFKRVWSDCKKRRFIVLSVTALAVCLIISSLGAFLSPSVYALAETAVKGKATECINSSVCEIFSAVSFDDIYTVSQGSNGEISGIFLNSLQVNKLKTQIVNEVCKSVSKLDASVEIPIGNISNNLLFGGHGRTFKVKIISVGAVESELINKIEDSGVNQTHLSSYVNIKAEITARIGRKNITVTTANDVLLCESVIAGRVPDSFVNVNVMDEETIKWLNSYK